MRHALGTDRGGASYRNHFVTYPGSADEIFWQGLVALSLAEIWRTPTDTDLSTTWRVTDTGRAALKELAA